MRRSGWKNSKSVPSRQIDMYRTLLIILLFALCGCSTKVPMVKEVSPMPGDAACRVVLLPFLDESNFPQGGSLVNKVLLAELVDSGKFQVVDQGDVTKLYHQFRIYPNKMPTGDQLKMIGGRLSATLFIGGDILKMKETKKSNFIETELTIALQLYDGRTGRAIWSTYHHRLGKDYKTILHFGQINTITDLAQRMSQEIINLWIEKGITPCAD